MYNLKTFQCWHFWLKKAPVWNLEILPKNGAPTQCFDRGIFSVKAPVFHVQIRIWICGSEAFWLDPDPDPKNDGSIWGSIYLIISMNSWQSFEWFTFLKFENLSSSSKVRIFFHISWIRIESGSGYKKWPGSGSGFAPKKLDPKKVEGTQRRMTRKFFDFHDVCLFVCCCSETGL